MRGLKLERERLFARIEKSHPSRVRGLKLPSIKHLGFAAWVAPLAGAWIETLLEVTAHNYRAVAPLAGAWIETINQFAEIFGQVAPLAGAWIETLDGSTKMKDRGGRTPRGCVD